MNSFGHIANQLSSRSRPAAKVNSIARGDYEIFCKEYVFDNIREIPFGESFCMKFNITDFVLSILPNEISAKKHIETIGYIKNDVSSN